MSTGAVLVIITLASFGNLPPDNEGFAKRALQAPTATVRQFLTLSDCQREADRWLDDLEEVPLPGRTVRVFCVTP